MKTIVLVCIGNFQEYIMTNIAQLVRLGHKREQIHVVVSQNIAHEFEPLLDFITLAYADRLDDEFDFNNKSQLDKQFRDGFWHYTSARMFVLYAYMKSIGLERVVHIENDVLIYYNVDTVFNGVQESYIYMPFDSYMRNVASIMYIPTADILGRILATYDYSKNDMHNFSNKPLVLNVPICVPIPGMSKEQLWVSKPLTQENPYIFDAAALGQMVGGVDPRNIAGDTRGFVNEECVIKYNDYGTIVWIDFKPYYRLHMKGIAFSNPKSTAPFSDTELRSIENDIPIFNLHIHSKNLHLFCF